MALTIWKAVLPWEDEPTLEVPQGADFLCAREQHEEIAVWFRCDPKMVKVKRTLIVCGTGHPTAPHPVAGRYLGTASLRGGALVFHVFEKLDS